jgi:hypothetical protein
MPVSITATLHAGAALAGDQGGGIRRSAPDGLSVDLTDAVFERFHIDGDGVMRVRPPRTGQTAGDAADSASPVTAMALLMPMMPRTVAACAGSSLAAQRGR